MIFTNISWSEAVSLGAFAISFSALVVPLFRQRQSAKINEILTVPTLTNAVWIYVIVSNRSTSPLSIHGATLNGTRLYRHEHYFATRGKAEGKQYSTKFPVLIAPQSEVGLLMEFVNPHNQQIARHRELPLILYADRRPIKKKIVISQNALTPRTALREI